MSDDLSTWERAQLDDDERVALDAGGRRWRREAISCVVDAADNWLIVYGEGTPSSEQADHIALHDPARVLDRIRADRRILDEHASEWRTVEWPHDQNGKGEGLVCRRCQNAEYTEWHPAVGEAGVLPEGFVAPYILAPCRTVRLLALHHAARPGYRESWKP
jgi:hypothetical protein